MTLNRCITECPQHGIDSGLITRSLSLEPFKNILIDSQRNGSLGRQRLKPSANQAANNMLHVSLRVRPCWSLRRSVGFETRPISFGLHRSKFATRAWWLCGTR